MIFALTRGGVPVGFEVADRLRLGLDVMVARKIGVPWQPELAMGALAGSVQVLDALKPNHAHPDEGTTVRGLSQRADSRTSARGLLTSFFTLMWRLFMAIPNSEAVESDSLTDDEWRGFCQSTLGSLATWSGGARKSIPGSGSSRCLEGLQPAD